MLQLDKDSRGAAKVFGRLGKQNAAPFLSIPHCIGPVLQCFTHQLGVLIIIINPFILGLESSIRPI
jgi:hypothetical protein